MPQWIRAYHRRQNFVDRTQLSDNQDLAARWTSPSEAILLLLLLLILNGFNCMFVSNGIYSWHEAEGPQNFMEVQSLPRVYTERWGRHLYT